jgi:hypothetical protein
LHVYSVLEDLLAELGYAPTYRQMLERLEWSPNSKGTLGRVLNQLRELGLITGRERTLRIVGREE